MNKSLWCSWVVQHEQMILETADRRRDSGTAIESEKIDVKPVEKRQIISSIFFGGYVILSRVGLPRIIG